MKNYYFEPFDIIVFPVIDWYYRFQRPQQLATRLADHGHRVFYLRTYFLEGTKPVLKPVIGDSSVIDLQLGLLVNKNLVADQLDENSQTILLDQFDTLRRELNITKAICIVDLPFWAPLVLELQKQYGWKIIYDAMDQLGGFSNVTTEMLEPEEEMIKKSDLVLTTSHLLFNEKSQLNPNCLLVPNGTEFDHFNYSSGDIPSEFKDIEKPVVGYYGAMSDWLDTELIYDLASARPNWNFVFVGRIETADVTQISKLSNVHLLGEKPYQLLPNYLHHFDTCIIPFKKMPLTEATNPVKLFEFLSAGKSVVATELNELSYYRDYVRFASSPEEWLSAIEVALTDYLPAEVERRMSFARQNTWEERLSSIEDAIQALAKGQTYDSTPLPLILHEDCIVSKRLLTQHDGTDYWCILYEKDDIVYKQTSFDLAEREAHFLSQFDSDYFPRFLDVKSESDYSVIRFKKIQYQSLHEALSDINLSAVKLHDFIQHCLNILVHLKAKGVTHRNISRENMVVQDGKPVLLDFGWAISEGESYFSPVGLGGVERPTDGSFSDVYSLGKVLAYINRLHYHAFDWIISLMTAKDFSLRINDLAVLKLLFNTALEATVENHQ